MKLFLLIISVVYLLPSSTYSQEMSTHDYVQSINRELKINNPGRNNDRSSEVELTSNGYFYLYRYYKNQKIGESRIHIEDISNIEYTGGLGELYLKLECKNSKQCSINTDYGKDTVSDSMLLQVIESRSGDYIKEIMRKIVLKRTGTDSGNYMSTNFQTDKSRKVYCCNSLNSYAYHSIIKCDGLSNCQKEIYSISENVARKNGYRYCELCWE